VAGITEVPAGGTRFERVGAHTRVRGLGLDENLKAVRVKDGMVGQERAREAAGLVVQMIKEGKMSGKTVIFAGRRGQVRQPSRLQFHVNWELMSLSYR